MSVRKVTVQDRDEITRQIQQEPYHKDAGFTADQFFEPDTVSMAFCDDEGVIAYGVVRKVAHLHLQFVSGVSKERVRKRFEEEVPGVMGILKNAGYKQALCDTKNPAMAWFLRRFGFRALKDSLMKWL